ncbi:MAG: DHA1 family bicyclomycin/chloramphenicol resistance-like MFS transporter [Parvibaculaceae bacterium]|jgi:DHA1 family bicyclomycin/chloramphenicol resistance-like MFS transporter|nr:multidrug effflux MFS transporter [Parvibaculaceae bacterium]
MSSPRANLSPPQNENTEADASVKMTMGFKEFVVFIACLMALNALAIDIMLPALPNIGTSLGADVHERQTILTVYMFGFGIAQLFFGPLADAFGRKKVLIPGLVLYIVSGIGCVYAFGFDSLLVARFLQGVGAAATRVIAVSIVRDCYGGRRMASVMSLAMIVFIAVPIMAPSVGALILLAWPWPMIFFMLVIGGMIMLGWTAWRLPETLNPQDKAPLSLVRISKDYFFALTSRLSLGYMLAMGFAMGAFFGFLNSAQPIYEELYGLGDFFTVAFAFNAAFMAIASLVNSRFVEQLGMRVISHGALLALTVINAAHLIVALAGLDTFAVFIAFQCATLFCAGLIIPNCNALAMEPLGHIAGTGSSALGFVTTTLGAYLGYLIGQAYNETTIPVAGGYALCGFIALAIIFATERGRLFKAGH